MYALRHSCMHHTFRLLTLILPFHPRAATTNINSMIACSVCRYVVIIVLCTVVLTIMCEYCIALQNLQLPVSGSHPLVAKRMHAAAVTLNTA